MIKISNICLHQNSIFIKFLKILKIHEIFCENPRIIFVLFYDVHKENMFTTNLEDGREAPSKARKKGAKRLEFLVYIQTDKYQYIYKQTSINIYTNRQISIYIQTDKYPNIYKQTSIHLFPCSRLPGTVVS